MQISLSDWFGAFVLPHPLPTFRRRLMTMVLVSTLPLAICAACALFTLTRNEERQVLSRALEANRQTATAVRVTLSRSFTVLATVAQSSLLDHDDLQPFMDQMARVLPLMPNWQSLLIAVSDGRVVGRVSPHAGSPSPALVEPASFAQMLASPGPIVGEMAKGPSGTWAIPLRVPAIRDGNIRYVLTATLLPQAIANVLTLSRLPSGWTISVFDQNGRRIARLPPLDAVAGTQVSTDLTALMQAGGDEGSGITTTTEGTEVYTAYVRLPELGWTVATGIPTAEVTTKVEQASLLYGGGLALSALLAGLGALFAAHRISAPMRELRDAALAVGNQQSPILPTAQIAEIQEVAVALRQSAEALKVSEDARCRAMESLATAHEALIEGDTRKDIFIATLAHELRNPLAPVIQAAAMLRKVGLSEAQRNHNLAVIERQTGNLRHLLDDLLDISRISVGKISLRIERVDLRGVLAHAREAIEAKAHVKKLVIRNPEVSNPIYIDGDSLRLQQIFVNLLDNAVKYTPDGGKIDLFVQLGETQVKVEIVDNGIGIPEDKMDEIFLMFGRVANPGIDVGGLGLGLALVKDLTEQHQGKLEASSPGIGLGSCFRVILPLSKTQLAVSLVSSPSSVTTRSERRVIVADDNHDIASTLQALLEMEGHHVRLASDGQQAVMLCEQNMPDVALLDIGMPHLDGYEAARAIRALPGGEKVMLIALSGWGGSEDVRKALDAGFDNHLTKPPDLDALFNLVSASERSPGT